MTARILVLGASGFIGARVVQALAASAWAVPVAASRRAAPPGAGPAPGLHAPAAPAPGGHEHSRPARVRLDATDADSLREALAGIDAVVNCVSGNAQTIVATARALFEVAGTLTRPPRIVNFSSMAVYGSRAGAVDEDAPLDSPVSGYGAAKVEAERLAAGYGNVVTLRPGIVYGPHSPQWSGRIARLLHSHRLGDLGAGGDGLANLVFIDDTVAAVLSALQLPDAAGRSFNLGSAEPPTWNDYFSLFARRLGAVPLTRITRRRLKLESKLLAPPLKVAEILLGRLSPALARRVPPPLPGSLLALFKQELRLDVGRAEAELGMRWTPWAEGVERSAAWYRATADGNAQ